MKACAGSGGKVAVGIVDGVIWTGMDVLVCATVGVVGMGVTGNDVGTGPGGLIEFFTYIWNTSMRQERRDFTKGIWYTKTASRKMPVTEMRIFLVFLDMGASLPRVNETILRESF